MGETEFVIMNNILISIIIPVYNSEKVLAKCLNSLVNQTYKNIEIICVNDCSKDNSEDIINKYLKYDNRIKLINHTENKNAGGARNTGIHNAKGDYICFVDNDDWLALDAINTMINFTRNGEIDIIVPKWCDYYNERNKTIIPNLIVGGSKRDNILYALKNGLRILGCLIKRDLIVKNNIFFPEKTFWEDNAIICTWIYEAKEISVIDYVAYYYKETEGSSSRCITLKKITDRINTTDLFVNNLRNRNYYNQDKDLINWKFLSFTYFSILMLSHIKYKYSKALLDTINLKIERCLPNPYFKDFSLIERIILKHPKISCFVIRFSFIYKIKQITKSLLNYF